MKRNTFLILAVLFITVEVLIGCGGPGRVLEPPTITENVKLFFGDADNEKIVSEERRISYRQGEDKYTVILQELIKGPEDKSYRANISRETIVYGTIRQNDALIVDFSRDFSRFSGSMAETIGLGSVVNTLTQFEAFARVKILVEGEEYIGPSGMPQGFMEPFPPAVEPPKEEAEVTLYFSNPDATAIVGEQRLVSFPAGTDRSEFIRLVLGELIKGPRHENLSITIPPQVKVLGVRLEDHSAHVDFSAEMHAKHWGGATGESLTINSVVNTLTEFPPIRQVKMTVEGKPMNIEHAVLEDPVERNEAIIQDENPGEK